MIYHFYDTSALLELRSMNSFNTTNKLCICSETLKEIESIKTNPNKSPDVKVKAKRVIKLLIDNESLYLTVIPSYESRKFMHEKGLLDTPDNRIISCAYDLQYSNCDNGNKLYFYTNDLNMRAIARCFGLNIADSNSYELIYKGYKEIIGTSNEINDFMSDISFNTNEYCIIQNQDDGTIKEMRFDGKNFVALRLPPSKYIKSKNSLQRCALDLMMNPNITIVGILGTYGSGKSFLTMQMARYLVCEKGTQSKILGVREPHGEGKEIGYLPGEFSSKTEYFFAPLMQQLDGGIFELEDLKHRGILEEIIPFYLKGMTYNNTIILVDEAEDLTEKQLRLVGTRVGQDSKIFFSGDYKQSLINPTEENALVRMCNTFKGNPKFGCIVLSEDVRSETSQLFANLFT
jgi:predicted ribonuclease YlaK